MGVAGGLLRNAAPWKRAQQIPAIMFFLNVLAIYQSRHSDIFVRLCLLHMSTFQDDHESMYDYNRPVMYYYLQGSYRILTGFPDFSSTKLLYRFPGQHYRTKFQNSIFLPLQLYDTMLQAYLRRKRWLGSLCLCNRTSVVGYPMRMTGTPTQTSRVTVHRDWAVPCRTPVVKRCMMYVDHSFLADMRKTLI